MYMYPSISSSSSLKEENETKKYIYKVLGGWMSEGALHVVVIVAAGKRGGQEIELV